MGFQFGKRKRNKKAKIAKKVNLKRNEARNKMTISLEEQNSGQSLTGENIAIASAQSTYQIQNKNNEEPETGNELSNISFISDDNLRQIESHKLQFEVDKSTTKFDTRSVISGNRIVELGYVLNWALELQKSHDKICTSGRLYVHKEIRQGLNSIIYFKCTSCNKVIKKSTEDPTRKISVVHEGVVWGTYTSGSTFTNTKILLNTMDIPMMSHTTFEKTEKDLGNYWQNKLTTEILKAGKEEYEIAEKDKNLVNGLGQITVYLDGGWSKRSYGHNYNASSGVACIIGKKTKKVLYMGVRNKYCSVCSIAERNNVSQKEHFCYKNWEGASSAMEADIIVQGFMESESMHKLQYTRFVADGDSSVYARIKEKVTYGSRVLKMECANHVIKNYSAALYKIVSNTAIPLKSRSILKSEIQRLKRAARGAIKYNSENEYGSTELLKIDLENGPKHVFGNHENCREYYCRHEKTNNSNTTIQLLETDGVFLQIMAALNLIVKKADRLTSNETNNRAELFMSYLAKFNCGKRLNLTQRGNFQRRCVLTGLKYQSGNMWQYSPWKNRHKRSPGKYFKKSMSENKPSGKSRKRLFDNAERNSKSTSLLDTDYGPNADDFIEEDELNRLCNEEILKYKVNRDQIKIIERQSVGQHGNLVYDTERANRLTASIFGRVCKRRSSTSCHVLVRDCLYKHHITTKYMKYGLDNEYLGIRMFENQTNKKVIPSGLFIDEENGYLAASPDGLVLHENAIIEVKCLGSLHEKKISLEEACKNTNFCMELKNGEMALKLKHNYHYQIQGQLHICKKDICYFIVFINKDTPVFILKIERNDLFWEEHMRDRLINFYKKCVLPEIVLRRIQKGFKCREPPEFIPLRQKHQ